MEERQGCRLFRIRHGEQRCHRAALVRTGGAVYALLGAVDHLVSPFPVQL
jgi:hypothetical protein